MRVRVLEVDVNARKLRLTMRETDYVPPSGGDGGGGGGGRRGTRKAKSVEQFLSLSPEEWIGGTVASITSFGAFVAVDEETDGLLHISQIAEDHVSSVEDHLEVGQDVQVRVIEVDVDNCRLGLSMREPRQSAPRGFREKRDVSVLLGRDPDEFITGRVRVFFFAGFVVSSPGRRDGVGGKGGSVASRVRLRVLFFFLVSLSREACLVGGLSLFLLGVGRYGSLCPFYVYVLLL